MAKTLAQIEYAIAKLAKERDALRAKEVAGVVARIREAINHYDLTAADLGFGRATIGRTRIKATSTTRKRTDRRVRQQAGVIRFRDEHGNEWTGHGRRPAWFKEAVAAGKSAEDLAVK